MSGHVITDAAGLQALCARLTQASWIALDTEFMRVRTYRAQLCLIQIATSDVVVCVDPLAVSDLKPLLDLLYTPASIKVLHAARQDLEVFFDLRGAPPRPLFDTQIAAALIGYDDQLGYGALVEAVTGHKLAKLEARTDWAARPLSSAQLRYAEDDVRYLCVVYQHLVTRLAALGREQWLMEECAALTDPALYRNDPEQAWQRLGAGATLTPAQQTVLAALAAWRERAAQQRDLPRGWVVPDAVLVESARRVPDSTAALAAIPDAKPSLVRRDGPALLEVIAQAQRAPIRRLWPSPERLDPAQMTALKRLGTIVQQRARAAGVSPTLVAPRRELVRLVRGDLECALLRGWRRAFIGEELFSLCQRAAGG